MCVPRSLLLWTLGCVGFEATWTTSLNLTPSLNSVRGKEVMFQGSGFRTWMRVWRRRSSGCSAAHCGLPSCCRPHLRSWLVDPPQPRSQPVLASNLSPASPNVTSRLILSRIPPLCEPMAPAGVCASPLGKHFNQKGGNQAEKYRPWIPNQSERVDFSEFLAGKTVLCPLAPSELQPAL